MVTYPALARGRHVSGLPVVFGILPAPLFFPLPLPFLPHFITGRSHRIGQFDQARKILLNPLARHPKFFRLAALEIFSPVSQNDLCVTLIQRRQYLAY